jgi:hypothetical protein
VTEVNPQGTTSTQKITQTSSGGFVWFPRTFTGNETFSVFVKKDSSNFARLYAANNSVYFDIVNGTITNEIGSEITDKSIIDYGNGWFRISISVNSTASNVRIYPASSGTSSNGTNSMFVWGAQLEAGSYATSYIPTNGATATRNAETSSKANISNLINSSEGVLYVETKGFIDVPTFSRYIQLSKNGETSFNNALVIQHRNNGFLRIYANGTASSDIHFNINIDFTQNNKIAVLYKLNGYKLFINGVSQPMYSTPTQTVFSGLDTLSFDNRGTYGWNGQIKDLRVYNTALTDQELIALTTI